MGRLLLPTIFYGIFLAFFIHHVTSTIVFRGEENWSHKVILNKPHGVRAWWRNTHVDDDGTQWIIMEITAKTRGYVGVGFSPKGAMTNADMVIGWVDDDGTAYLRDYHGVENGMPILDDHQDYQLISGFETAEGTTTIRFKRKWDTCDGDDMKLEKDTTRFIWSFGEKDPVIKPDGTPALTYHGIHRGVQSVFLSDDARSYNFPDESDTWQGKQLKTWDMTMKSVRVTEVNTTYHCRIEKFTDTGKKHHLIGWRPVIQEENLANVHHIVFYECTIPDNRLNAFDDYSRSHPGGNCYTKNMPPEWARLCTGFLLVWTVGAEGEMLPDHVGAVLGQEHGGATFFMIEMHYENPEEKTLYDSSGIRIYYTDDLRENDGAVLLLGIRHSPFLLVPQKQENFLLNGICARECLEKTLPEDGIRVVTTIIHAHLWGRRLRLRHIRNGTELPLIAEDNNYDFNYQQSKTLKSEIRILPGDELLTECEYETKDMNRPVLGGLSTNQEMCQTFLFYYPKIEIGQCTSQPEFHDFMGALGAESVSGEVLKAIGMPWNPSREARYNPGDTAKELEESGDGASYRSVFDQINIDAPKAFKGMTVGDRLREMDWTNMKLSKKVEDAWKDGKHYQYCTADQSKRISLEDNVVTYPKITTPRIIEQDMQCLSSSSRTSTSLITSVVLIFVSRLVGF